MLVVALLGDPIRKLTPNNPVFLSVCFVPIFGVIYLRILSIARKNKNIFSYYPSFKQPVFFYLLCLVFAFLNAFFRNPHALPLILFSLAQYLGIIIAVRVGYYFLRRENDLIKLVKIVVLTEIPFLFTVLLHFLGYQDRFPVLRTMRFEGAYVQFHGGEMLAMLNGIFRSPEPMGWNAMIVTIGALFLLVRGRQKILWNIFFSFASLFGIFCILMSGRRKFFLGVMIFVIIFLILIMRKNVKKMISILLFLLILFGFGWNYLSKKEMATLYIASAKSGYTATGERFKSGVYGSMIWAIKRDGFFGAGLGASTQGAAHFKGSSEQAGIESGPGKILSELGVPGFIAFVLLVLSYFGNLYKILKMKWFKGTIFMSVAFLFSLVLTHFILFLVSHQIYGDPFIALVTGLTFGMLLAIPRMIEADSHLYRNIKT